MRIKNKSWKRVVLLAYLVLYLGGMGKSWAASQSAVEAKNGMVVTTQRLASEAGLEILKMGGNAIDAAVAVGYAQAVVNPCCGNIGGGGYMVLHLSKGRNLFINFREKAPDRAFREMYLNQQGQLIPGSSLQGYRAVAVPGTVLGLDTVLKKYGTLTRQQVMAPAIKLAREGYILTRADTDVLAMGTIAFRQNPEAAKIFLRPDGTPWQPGERLIQTDLARTLTAIAQKGPEAFYTGRIPHVIEQDATQNGGIIKATDFAAYTIQESAPITCRYRGHELITAPPSGSGVTLCEMLNILAGYDLHAMGFGSAASIHVMVEAMRHAYHDRNQFLGDLASEKEVIHHLLSKTHATAIQSKILPDRATSSETVQTLIKTHPELDRPIVLQKPEHPETTHYSVVDKAGNAVSTTYTLNGRFGAGVIAPGTGFFLNNEMNDFTLTAKSNITAKSNKFAEPIRGEPNLFGLVQGVANVIEPGKQPLSSMAPTLVTREGKLYMVLGSPGGPRIPTALLGTLVNIIDYGMTPQEAVNAARFHHQWLPDIIYYEKYGVSPDTLTLLHKMGYKTVAQTPWGAVELIMIGLSGTPSTLSEDTGSSGNDAAVSGKIYPGYLYGANDPRRPVGAALGH